MVEKKEAKEIAKVCHVVRRFVKEKWGGTESVVYYLADQYEKKGVKSPVLTTSMFSKKGLQEFGRVAVYRFAYFLPWFGLNEAAKESLREKGGSPLSFSLFKFLWFQKDCSIIHTHTAHRLGGIARTVARLRGIPYVVSLHGGCLTLPDEQAEAMQEPFKGKFEWGKIFGLLFGSRQVLSDADAIICVGRDEYERMQQRYPNKRVYYQANGVSTSFFAEAQPTAFRDKYNIPSNQKIINCVSRIDSQKNQLLLLKAFAEFQQQHPGYKLVLIGPVTVTSYHDLLMKTAKELAIEEKLLLIPGFPLEDPLLASAYKAADMFVLPSRHEPFGIVILEAWAAGAAVIAAKVGGIPGFTTDGQDIQLFEDNNQPELVAALKKLAVDAPYKKALSTGGLDAVKLYDWSAIAEQTLDIYKDALRENQ